MGRPRRKARATEVARGAPTPPAQVTSRRKKIQLRKRSVNEPAPAPKAADPFARRFTRSLGLPPVLSPVGQPGGSEGEGTAKRKRKKRPSKAEKLAARAAAQPAGGSESPAPGPGASGGKSEWPLVILDLNGTICSRRKANASPRPGLSVFLNFLFSEFRVAVWSSAMAKNVDSVVETCFGTRKADLEFVWHRTKCSKDATRGSFATHKDLRTVWAEFPHYIAENTLLIDDSEEKGELYKENLLLIGGWDKDETDTELVRVAQYLTKLKRGGAVAQFIRGDPYTTEMPESERNSQTRQRLKNMAAKVPQVSLV